MEASKQVGKKCDFSMPRTAAVPRLPEDSFSTAYSSAIAAFFLRVATRMFIVSTSPEKPIAK